MTSGSACQHRWRLGSDRKVGERWAFTLWCADCPGHRVVPYPHVQGRGWPPVWGCLRDCTCEAD
jgi:hypothetical protein